MGSVLQSLKVVSATRPKRQSPVLQRRGKLLARIQDQIKAAEANARGEEFRVTIVRRKRDASGEMVDVSRQRKVKECWWVDDGKVMMELRYGLRSIEFAKGKSAIEVADPKQLIPTLELLKTAASNGEFDNQLESAATRFGDHVKAGKLAKSK
jgi:hypothetical protein